MRDLRLYTPNRVQEALSNLCFEGQFTVTDMMDACEDSVNGKQLANRLKALGLTEVMGVVRETGAYTRILLIDCFKNSYYLEARKD